MYWNGTNFTCNWHVKTYDANVAMYFWGALLVDGAPLAGGAAGGRGGRARPCAPPAAPPTVVAP